jgi:hypothetical protein
MSVERPIVFPSKVIPAILEGTKTQTRRPIKPQHYFDEKGSFAGFYFTACDGVTYDVSNVSEETLCQIAEHCRFGKMGDRLWVREQCSIVRHFGTRSSVIYKTDVTASQAKQFTWYQGMYMPRWACRIILEVTGVRVERLRQISKAEVIAEGILPRELVEAAAGDCLRQYYFDFWDRGYGKREYPSQINPWVWVIEFRRIDHQKRSAKGSP